MHLASLHLQQYRSYEDLPLDLSENPVHLFIGKNGAGKTNILEGIGVLSLTKSCLGSDEVDLMQWEKDFYRVTGNAESDTGEKMSFEVVSQMQPRKQKACFMNDVKTSIGDMVGRLPVIIFLPTNLDLFSGAPQLRRSYLDQLLCQVSPAYLSSVSQYQKILKQRNKLLKWVAEGRSKMEELDLWDQQLSEAGAPITLQRLELLEVLQCTLQEEVQALGEEWEQVALCYERKGEARERKEVREEYCALLSRYRERDVMLQSTTVGPHREDWRMEVDGRSLPTFASRGQQRTAVLALLFLQVSYLELRRGEKPIILLDDVFSELDDAHQSALLSSLSDHQVLLTSTHQPSALHGAQVWQVEDGKVSKV